MSEVKPKDLIVGNVYIAKKGKSSWKIEIDKVNQYNTEGDEYLDIEGTPLDNNDKRKEQQKLQISMTLNTEPGEDNNNPYTFYSIEEDPSLPGGRRRKTRRSTKKRKTRSKSRRSRV